MLREFSGRFASVPPPKLCRYVNMECEYVYFLEDNCRSLNNIFRHHWIEIYALVVLSLGTDLAGLQSTTFESPANILYCRASVKR